MGTTNESRLRIVIEAKNSATGEMQKMTTELRKIEKATGEADKKQKGLMQTLGGVKAQYVAAAAAVAGAALAIKKGFEFAEEGAGISRMSAATKELAASMGGNMDQIVASVREASSGTVNNLSIMQATGRAMMLGLGSDAEKMANLMQVAMFRGRAMGLSAEQAFSDIVTGVGRLSPMILDNLGIVLDAEATYADYAASLGKTAGELTSMEKRQALLNRVLEEGNKMMDAAGGVADDAASSYERLGATMVNKFNEAKQAAGEFFAPVADWLAGQLNMVEDLQQQFSGMSKEIAMGSLYYEQYTQQLHANAEAAGLAVNANGDLVQEIQTSGGVIERVIVANFQWSKSLYDVMVNIENIPDDSFVEKARRMEQATTSAKMSLEDLNRFMRGDIGKETERFGDAQEKTAQQIADVEGELKKLGVNPYATPEQLSQIDQLNQKLVGAYSTLRSLEEGTGASKGLFSQGQGKMEEAGVDPETIQRVNEINGQIYTLYNQIEELGGKPFLTEAQRAQIDELKGKLAELQGQQTENTEEHKENMNRFIFDMAKAQMEADGTVTQAEQDAQIALAQKMGLIDEETAALWEQTQGWVTDLTGAAEQAEEIGTKIEDIPAFKRVMIEIEAVGDIGILPFLEGQNQGKSNRKDGDNKLSEFADGGSFTVPGMGGIDSQYVAFKATPGEHVEITPPGRRAGGGGGGGVTLKNYGTIIVQSLDEIGYGGRL